ncbi:GNAT family N-acetyltransferase [Nocardia sp. NPDC101769]|uniref:GNAT family N-acetyltransferase n=1 Tax=Nocardia sp. NPDC101769 TaxID=3364333 RepID=UPI0038043DDA
MAATGIEAGPAFESRIEDARLGDTPEIVHVIREGARSAYGGLRVLPGKPGLPAFLTDLATRKPREIDAAVRAGRDTLLVQRIGSGRIVGFAKVGPGESGARLLEAWYVLPEFHGTGLARLLMRRAILAARDRPFYAYTTAGTRGHRAYAKLGFILAGEALPTPGPLAAAGLVAPQLRADLPAEARRRLLRTLPPGQASEPAESQSSRSRISTSGPTD